jgi:RNA polymerase sigma-70 factor (ECF subfamily)
MYWYPVYAYARRHGHSREDAEDLTQEFFSRIVEKQILQAVSEERGRFRWFLLTALKRFLANEWNREQAKKRGGGLIFFSLEFTGAEGRYLKEPMHEVTPEKVFNRGWSLTILERTLGRLRAEHSELGNSLDFDRLKTYLTGDAPRGSYSRLAAEIGLTEGAARVAVHRMRRRFGDLLRAEIRETVANEQEVDDEIRFLFEAVGA